MKKKIAIPMENGKLCSHFGHCQYFAIATVENRKITDMQEQTPPAHEPGVYPAWVASFGVTDVIAGGMGQKAIDLFIAQKINVFVGAPLQDAKTLVEAFLLDKLTLTSNFCDSNHECRH